MTTKRLTTLLLPLLALLWLLPGVAQAQTTTTYTQASGGTAMWGSFGGVTNFSGVWAQSIGSTEDTIAIKWTGTKLEFEAFAPTTSTTCFNATTDGVLTQCGPGVTYTFTWVTAATGLTDTTHTTYIKMNPTAFYAYASGSFDYVIGGTVTGSGLFRVTGAAPAASPPTMPAAYGDKLIVFHGDSRTAGYQSSAGYFAMQGTSYPADTLAVLPAYKGQNQGISSEGDIAYGGISPGFVADAVYNVDSQYNPVRALNLLVFAGGYNDMGAFGQTAATTEANTKTYGQARQSVGWIPIVTTVLHGNQGGAITTGTIANNVQIDAYNTYELANYRSQGFAWIINLTTDSRLSDPTNTTYFNADEVHLTDAGYLAWEQDAAAQLGPVLNPGYTLETAINNRTSGAPVIHH